MFGYVQKGSVTVFALEPLIPSFDSNVIADEYHAAWREFDEEVKTKIVLYVSVYDDFLSILKKAGYQALHIGKEPYVLLSNCIPTGKSGKGVRAARNQALRAGVAVEEWSANKIQADKKVEVEMREILKRWKSRNVMELGGFLNTVNPFEKMKDRRYFLARKNNEQLEAFLVATPIPGKKSYFLEDMVVRPGAARGAGELLTLEAMIALAESKAEMASLGVVALTSINENSGYKLPRTINTIFIKIPKFLSRFYNASGLETFRKRFKPHIWENVSLAVKNNPSSGVSDTKAWFRAFGALLLCFTPKFRLSSEWFTSTFLRPILRYPTSHLTAALFIASFCFINRGGELPTWALNSFGISGDTPILQWFYRTFTSDFLFFDATHFGISLVLLWGLIRWMERTYSKNFVIGFVLATSFLDDFINQILLIRPYRYFQPHLFSHLIAIKDVGPSLWIAVFIGLQLVTMKRNREVLFAILLCSFILVFSFSASHYSNLILNLNHPLFLAFGYICGKIRFHHEQEASRKVAKQKPPVAKSVLNHEQKAIDLV